MRTSALLTAALLGSLLLWASCARAEGGTDEGSGKDGVQEGKATRNKTTEIEEENDVMVLHIHNFDRALSENKYLLVEFYAPWCGHCKSLLPVYEEVAGKLKDEDKDMRLAKVDATEEKELAEEFNVQGFPTISLFVNGDRTKPREFTGERTAGGIVTWMKRQASPEAPTLDTPDAVAQYNYARNVSVVAFVKDMKSETSELLDELFQSSDVELAKTSSPEAFNKYEVTEDTVVLFKKFDEGRVDFPLGDEGKLDQEKLLSFIQENSLELITRFSAEVSGKIFSSSVKVHTLMFVNSSLDAHMALVEETRGVAKEFKGKSLFILLDINDPELEHVKEYFGVKASDAPTVRIYDMNNRKKYSMSPSPFTPEAVRQLCQGVLDGTAQTYYKSQEIPEDWDKNPVKVLVGKNFKSVALDPSKNVFVVFCAPWNVDCQDLAPAWDQLGEKYTNHTDIVIAKMDATVNEAEEVVLTGIPTLTYYPAGGEKEVQYFGDKTLEKMSEFLDSGGVQPEQPTFNEGDDYTEEEGDDYTEEEGDDYTEEEGDDHIEGEGDDHIEGEEGDDHIEGEEGDDHIEGEGDDHIEGEEGDDHKEGDEDAEEDLSEESRDKDEL
ncbi:protein disulfide-isomerase-like [Eucyclogobius newberryi]|uniref:protein disulfide-isomerase-like n=1 Tax=Eucyclogobius newberryi TaxID=166745 RepID=UPI003B5B98E7